MILVHSDGRVIDTEKCTITIKKETKSIGQLEPAILKNIGFVEVKQVQPLRDDIYFIM